jgi:hypothetical protein
MLALEFDYSAEENAAERDVTPDLDLSAAAQPAF